MPWDVGSKTYIRTNPDYSGSTVWQQDQGATIKIIASRHDIHDQDLATGISRCWNIDGVNGAAANMDFNGYKGINLIDGVDVADSARYGQIITDVTFDNGTRTLSMTTPGGTDYSVNIPASGAGVGTMESVTIGEGLTGDVNPITVSGDVRLEVLGSEQTFSGGIGSITIDKHGRVTQVTTSAIGGTNLGVSVQSASVTVTSDTGTDAVISSASQTVAGVMSAADKTKLDGLTAVGGTNLTADVSSSQVVIQSSTGNDAVIPPATTSLAGVMTSVDKTNFDNHLGLTNAHIDWTANQGAINIDAGNITQASVTQHEGAINHDALTNFVANEHIDWTSASASINTSGTVTGGNLLTANITISSNSITSDTGSISMAATGITTTGTIAAGVLTATGDITAFVTSDIATKRNIEPISNALEKVARLTGSRYEYKTKKEGLFYGLMAQDMQKVMPELVHRNDDGELTIRMTGFELIALLVEAVKELKEKVDGNSG